MVIPMFDDEFLFAKIKKVEESTVNVSDTSTAGMIPVTDGDGGYDWGSVPSGTLVCSDANSDGDVVISISQGA